MLQEIRFGFVLRDTSIRNRLSSVLIGAALILGVPGWQAGAADLSAGWRVYKFSDRLADTFASSVTISPKTNVWVRHGSENDRISRLDGYNVRTFAAPGEGTFPIHESRSGQLWSLYPEGVMLFHGEEWGSHPIGEVRALFEADPLRQVKSVPLVAAELDHVFLLLPDRLLSYQAQGRKVTTLLLASETGLGRFHEMAESSLGGLWITGLRGMGHVEGPLRQIRAGLRWKEWPAPEGVQGFQRPIEVEAGEVVTIAERAAQADRVVAIFKNDTWELLAGPSARIRYAWRSLQGGYWACARDALWEWNGHSWNAVPRGEGIPTGYNDVAVDAAGAFWLATSEGLVRHAPKLWARPFGGGLSESPVHGISTDSKGVAWFAGPEELLRYEGGVWQRHRIPMPGENSIENARVALVEGGSSIWVGAAGLVWRFDQATSQFARWSAQRSDWRIVGRLRDGRVVVQSRNEGRLELVTSRGEGYESWLIIPPEWGLGEEVSAMVESETSDVWLGGNGSVVLWRQGDVRVFSRSQGFIPVRAQSLVETAPGMIWCGGGDIIQEYDGRAWRLVKAGFERVQQLRKARDGAVLVASSSGAHRYFDGSWSADGFDEGLPTLMVFDVAEDGRGRRWAATSRGPVLYDDKADHDAPRSAVIPAKENRGLAGAESHRFMIRGADRWRATSNERLLFSRRLDGGAWSPFETETSLTFSGLAAGTHRLEVRAMDRAWNRERTPTVMEFSVVLPWQRDPRLVGFSAAGLLVVLFFAGLAVNRHRRLVKSYAEVERIVGERTRELERANRELLHSQKMKALGTLAAGVAHDFNNILSVIKGSTQVIEQNLDDRDKVLARAERIRTVVDQGATLVRSMLGMGRGASESPVECGVKELIEGASKSLGEAFSASMVLDIRVHDGTPRLLVIRNLLQQILHNLMANAADAMGGKGVIRVEATRLDHCPPNLVLQPAGTGPWVEIVVEDTGSGIDPEALPRIFEPFFTTKAFSKRRGTGLGLSMVYEMAKGMGIGVDVRSNPGRGTRFTLLVPTDAVGQPSPEKRAARG